jgi:type II secretion system protein G
VPVSWIILLMAWFGDVAHTPSEARQAATRARIITLATALRAYKLDTGSFPGPEEGLRALRDNPGVTGWQGPYVQMDIPNDPWGRPYIYRIGPDGKPEIQSFGADGEPGGVDGNADTSSSHLDGPVRYRNVPLRWIGWLLAGAFGGIVYPLLPRLWRRFQHAP